MERVPSEGLVSDEAYALADSFRACRISPSRAELLRGLPGWIIFSELRMQRYELLPMFGALNRPAPRALL